ncbi:hypothetical protein B0T11DRAFT_286695 [Plectosphaerella cucumerina]|uniref:Uncharacterized protein n=1 Tax=Plectosphaerella cucumerina TaxID=40658 RepID=A0A8K0X0M4_9PEZI|nr:hypothetical protein B0T11DRAFT_286695 [Plectosphaerella cucumerina]
MQFFALITALFASAALAYPGGGNHTTPTPDPGTPPPPPVYPPGAICTPGTYQCRSNPGGTWGWDVCNTDSRWVDGGNCAPSDTCIFNALNGSPYCVPTSTPSPGPGSCTAGKTRCTHVSGRWTTERCDSYGTWRQERQCSAGETCTYAMYSGDAFCVPNVDARVCRPGTYQCAFSSARGGWGWEVCTVEGTWVWGGNCAATQTCSFNQLNGSPYCL